MSGAVLTCVKRERLPANLETRVSVEDRHYEAESVGEKPARSRQHNLASFLNMDLKSVKSLFFQNLLFFLLQQKNLNIISDAKIYRHPFSDWLKIKLKKNFVINLYFICKNFANHLIILYS